jgi:hypothetical protein
VRKSTRLVGAVAALVLVLGAAQEASAQLRGIRYCEVLPVYSVGGALVADVWNTTGFNLCPQADFDALDPVSIAQDLGALIAILNGPRYWVLDFIVGTPSNEVMTFGNLTMRLAATLDVPAGGPAPPYTDNSVNRDTEFIFFAGSEVYELVDPAGSVYVMQSYSHQIDDTLTEADLPDLGSRLQLPAGWEFRARVVSADYVVEDQAGVATVVQDELRNTYQLAAPAPEPGCNDGLDNDGDGSIDLDDPDCTDENDPLEARDADDDLVEDGLDNCVQVSNPGQIDTDGDDYGNACDCDFDQNGQCNAADFSIFLEDYIAAVDRGVGTDMDCNGAVSIADFSLFRDGYVAGAPGPSGLVPVNVGHELLDANGFPNIVVWGTQDLTIEEYDALTLPPGWMRNQPREGVGQTSRFLRSPGRDADGDFTRQEMFGVSWLHQATVVSIDGPVDAEGLLTASTVEKHHELTWRAGSSVTILTSPEGARYILVSRDARRTSDTPTIPDGWMLEVILLGEDLQILLPLHTTVIRSDNEDSFQGPLPSDLDL